MPSDDKTEQTTGYPEVYYVLKQGQQFYTNLLKTSWKLDDAKKYRTSYEAMKDMGYMNSTWRTTPNRFRLYKVTIEEWSNQ